MDALGVLSKVEKTCVRVIKSAVHPSETPLTQPMRDGSLVNGRRERIVGSFTGE